MSRLRTFWRGSRFWPVVAIACVALLLMGAGGLTASRLFVTASVDGGDKLLVQVGSQDVLRVSSDGTDVSVELDAGAGGSTLIHDATFSGATGFGDGADDRFRLPRLSADPATDVEEGMMYYNTTSEELRVYQGGTWQAAGSGGSALPSGAIVYAPTATDSGLLSAGFTRAPALDFPTPADDLSAGAPEARRHHTAVWTGEEMIVWGGEATSGLANTGGRYNPLTGLWTPMSTTNAPSARRFHSSVWTGSEVLVWGGNEGGVTNTGARYNPATDTWSEISTSGAPSARERHTAVWTGSRMLVWGGRAVSPTTYMNDGASYDPGLDEWVPIQSISAPTARAFHTAIWTGSEMVVWGGFDGSALATGARFDPVVDSWQAITQTSAPAARRDHTSVWTGTEMIVWGGLDGVGVRRADGGRYAPGATEWAAVSGTGAPDERTNHTAVWTGSEVLVWGGFAGATPSVTDTGGIYNPATNGWTSISTMGAPFARELHSAIWTGEWMLIWGGFSGSSRFQDGGVYDVGADDWTRRLYAYRAP